MALPVYTVLETFGREHNQIFKVECDVDALSEKAVAEGRSRRKAEQSAADLILRRLEQ